ncbi:MAG: glycosyltransferase [Flavobacteriales bacterium]
MSSISPAIAFLSSSTSWGGLEMNLVRWAHWFSEEGEEVKVFCQKDSKLYAKARELELPIVLIKGHRKYYDFKAAWRLSGLLKENFCSTVIFRDTKDMSTLGLAKTFSCAKLKLIYFQGMRLGVYKRDLLHTIRFRQLDYWVTPLNLLKEEVLEHTRFPEKRITVIPLAIENSFVPKRSAGEVREELGVKKEELLLGVIGRLDPGKCQDIVIRALAQVNYKSSLKLLILGDETAHSTHNYKMKLETLVSELGLKESVILKPSTSDVASYMNALDVFIMSSEAETFGMVTIEALWLNKVVIGTDSGGTPEILGRGKYGCLVEPKNVEELAQAIETIQEDVVKYSEIAKESGLFARNTYHRESFVSRLLSLISLSQT